MKIIKRGTEAREALKRGIDLAADCIKVTLGPTGRNAVLGRQNLPPTITNDGVTVARNIEAEDPFENQGVWIVKEAASLTDLKAGDGTTTTTVILQKIVETVFARLGDDGSLLRKKVDTIQFKKEIDIACQAIIEHLKSQKQDITEADIWNVAKVSGEYDWIADMLAEVFKIIGTNGYINLEEGNKTAFLTYKGIELGAGYPNEYFVNTDTGECLLKDPYVLVSNQPFEVTALVPIIEEMNKLEKRNLVLIAPDFSKDLLQRLTTAKLKTDLVAVVIRLPQTNDELYKDVATLTEAKFLDKNIYTKYEDFVKEFKLENLGKVDKAIIGSNFTRLIGGNGDTAERVKYLKQLHSETESLFDKDKLEKRMAFLGGGIATITIGGESDFEKLYSKLKMEDAVHAVQAALEEGVVPGGGLALKIAAEKTPESILTEALKAPYNQIQENTGGIEVGENVIDPLKTVVSALKSACSLAGMVITTEVLSVHKLEDKTKNFGPDN